MSNFEKRRISIQNKLNIESIVTYSEIGTIAGISKSRMLAIRELIDQELPTACCKQGRLYFYDRALIDDFLERVDITQLKPDWDLASRRRQGPVEFFGESRSCKEAFNFYSILNRSAGYI